MPCALVGKNPYSRDFKAFVESRESRRVKLLFCRDSLGFLRLEFLSLYFYLCDTSRMCLVNKLLLVRLQNAVENAFFPL